MRPGTQRKTLPRSGAELIPPKSPPGDLQRERGAAAAGGGRLGVLDLERLADEVVDEIDDRAFHVLQRDLVDEDLRAVLLDHEIVRLPGAVDVEAVGEPRAAAAVDANAQHRAGGLARHDVVDA